MWDFGGRNGYAVSSCTQWEKGVTRADQKKALLVHSAGNEVQDIYFTLTETDPSEN